MSHRPFTPTNSQSTRSPAPLALVGGWTPIMLKEAHGPGPIRSALRRLRAWWSEVGRKMDERWPDEPEDNLPDR